MSTPAPPPPPDGSGTPPPPPYNPPQPDPPTYGQPPQGQPPQAQPPGFGPAPGFEQKGPRPDARVGGSLIVAGAIIIIIGVFLPWLSDGGSRNGTDLYITSDLTVVDAPGNLMMGIAVIVGGLGIALFFAGRVLAVAIVAIVASSIAILMGLAMIGIMNDVAFGGDVGIGVILQPIAPVASLAGAIVVTARRGPR